MGESLELTVKMWTPVGDSTAFEHFLKGSKITKAELWPKDTLSA